MNEFEELLMKTVIESEPQLNPSVNYSDEFYEECISHFQQNSKRRRLFLFGKRLFDLFASSVSLVILFFPFLIIGIMIKSDSKGPVFFKQKRIGKHGKEFTCIKFRSMAMNAPSEIATSQFSNAGVYITKIGKFLRRTSIDELPQLINVLFGQMSLIGYRPLVPTEVNCNGMCSRLGVFSMKPGISGYAQIRGRDEVYYKNKALLDAYYVNHASFWFDAKIIIQTIRIVLNKSGNNS